MTFQELLARNGIRLSAEQEAAVYEDRAAVVSAGAGAGKTTVLSLRFVRLVMERKAHSDQIMTLTFTKKAAAEMYERIYRLLGCAAEGDGYLKAEMEEHFPKARISTLDSFWSEIARTDSMRYGVMRDFTLLEDDDAEDMARRIFIDMEDDAALRAALEETASFISSERLLAELVRIASVASDVTTPFSAEENARSAGLFAELALDYASGLLDEAVDALEAADSDNPENTLQERLEEDVETSREKVCQHENHEARTAFANSPLYDRFQKKIAWEPSPDDWAELFHSVDSGYPQFASTLDRDLPGLTIQERRLCYLIKINVKPSRVAQLLNMADNNVSMWRKRLFTKATGQAGGSKDFDSYILNI